MNSPVEKIIEDIQRLVVRMLATSPAGHKLLLIGGFRYRFLNASVRRSVDIDYHWEEDLSHKQKELISLFNKKLLPEVKRRFGYDGAVSPGGGPDAESDDVKVVESAFYREGVPHSRIEIPVDITRIVRLDSPEVRTSEGVVYPTVSDADLVESKVLAVLNRVFVQARDLMDIFLFQTALPSDVHERLAEKMARIALDAPAARRRLEAIEADREVYIKALEMIIEEQLDNAAAGHLRSAGGPAAVFDSVLAAVGDALERAVVVKP